MALKVADRVRENTSSTGAGGISFTGSPAGFQTFSSVLTSGDITYYTIEENDKWEVGIGTYGSDNLERNYILGSSNSGNKISLGGSGTVFITYPAEKSVYRNQESQAVVGASGLVFDNGTIIKDAKITELYDVNVSGTPASTHLLSFDVTNKGLLIGDSTGPSNNGNILMGYGAGSGITTSNKNVIIGTEAAIQNQGGSQNVHIGYQSGPVHDGSSSVVYNAVSVGYQAGHKMRHNSTAIGHQAGIDAYEIGFVAMGYQAASGIGSYSVAVGMEAGKSYNDDYATIIGYQAGYNGGGVDSIWVGRGAGHSSAGAARSVGIGKEAGKSSTANDSIYIGKSAGQSNTGNDLLFIGNASPAAMGTLIKGDMDSKRLAVGNADITLSDTFHVGINTATDKGVVIKSAAAQSADLTQWVNASDGILASVSNSGIVSANGLMASGAGLQVADNTPVVTANTLYSVGGGLYWNGSPLAGGGGTVTPAQLEYVSGIAVYASGEVGSGDVTTDQLNYVSGIAVYSSGQAIANEADIATNVTNISANVTDIVATSGIAAYASGNSITNESDISTNTTNIATNAADIVTASGALRTSINTNTTNISTNATDIVATSGIANYASGQAIANETDIATNVSNISTNTSNISTNTSNISTNTTNITSATNIANYASGQAIENEDDIVAVSGIAAYASGHAHDDLYVSGVAAYASGNTSNIAFGSNVEGDILYHDGTSFTRLPKGTDSHVLTMDGNVPAWEAATGGGGDVTTAQLVYVSGIAVYGSGQAESLNYASGVAAYASGNSLTNATNIATNAADIVTASGALRTSINTNASNISTNTTNITAATSTANYASGQALSLTYASGLTATNASNISTNTSNISTNTTNITAVTNTANYASGEALSLTYASGLTATNASNITTNASDIVAVSGIAHYASGQAIANETDIATNVSNISTNTTNITSTTAVANYASGQALSLTYASGLTATNASNITTNTTNITANASDIVAVSGIAHYASGHAHDDLYVSGVAAYASGQVNVTTDGTAEASKALILDADKSFSGVKNGRLNQFDSWLYSSGVNVGNSGVVLSSSTPSDTDNTLYNVAGTLYFNGTQLASAGGASPTAQYASGEALSLTYASGLTATNASNISTNTTNITAATNTANYASGEALSLTYASGLTATNASNISTNTTNITAATNTANYASGQALSLTYASGLTATNASNISTNTTNITAATNTANYASGQALSLTYASGLTATNAANISTNTTNIATNADNIVATSGIANYASGQAITNKTDIATNTSNISTNTSNISTNTTNIATNVTNIASTTAVANYASGEAVGVDYVSGVAVYASGQAIANEIDIATNTSNISTNTSNISTNTTNIASTTAVANYASGQAIENESDIVATSGIANYASGLAITNEANVAYASGNTSNITFGSNAEGDILYHDGSTFTRLAKGTDNHVLTMNGNVPNWEAATSSTTNASGAIYQVQYNADGANFGADPSFIFAKNNAAFTNPYVLAVSGTIIANTGDANYANPVSIGSGAYIGADDAIAIGKSAYVVSDLGIAMGSGARVTSGKGIAIGTNASSRNDNICIGENAAAEIGISIGHNVYCAYDGIGIGGNSDAHDGSVNIGGNPTHRRNAILGRGVTGASWQDTVGIGYRVNTGSTNTTGNWSTIVGTKAAYIAGYDSSYACVFGGQASAEYGSVAIGYEANAAGPFAVGLGYKVVAPEKHFVVASGAAQTSVMLSGVFGSHLSLPNGQQFRQIASAAQTTDLMQWQNSAGTNVAAMTPSGILNVYDIRSSGYGVVLCHNAQALTEYDIAIGASAYAQGDGAVHDGIAIGASARAAGRRTLAIGRDAYTNTNQATAVGHLARAEAYNSLALGYNAKACDGQAIAIGNSSEVGDGTSADFGMAIGQAAVSDAFGAIALGGYADVSGERSVAIGFRAKAEGTSWVIASGDNMATDVGISGVFGSYAAIPNDQKLAVGNPSGTVPTYRLDVMGHGAIARASGVIVGNSGVVLSDNVPAVTDYTLYRDGSDLKWNGSAIGGSTLTAGSGIAIVDNKVHFESKSSGGKVLSSIKGDNDNHATLMVSGTIVTNPADAARPGMVVIGSGAIGGYDNNVVIGKGASAGYDSNVVIGKDSKSLYWWGVNSVSIGIGCTSYANGVAMGYQATNFESDAIAIGIQARAGSNSIAIGKQVGWNNTNGVRRSVVVGHRAQNTSTNIEDVTVIGYDAEATGHRGTALGSYAEAGEHAVALGNKAVAPDGGFVVASGSALTDVLLSGVMKTHLTMPNGQQFIQMATAAQTSDLTQWQNSAGTNVASMTPSGILNVYDIRTSGDHVALCRNASAEANDIAIGLNSTAAGGDADAIAIGASANADGKRTIAIGQNANADQNQAVAVGHNAEAEGYNATSLGYSADAFYSSSTAIGGSAKVGDSADGTHGIAVGSVALSDGVGAIALGTGADANGYGSLAIGYGAVSQEKTWVIASGSAAAAVGISGVFGSYAAIPNDQKLAIGGNVPTYTVDALGHGAMVRATGVIVGNSGVVLSDNVPAVTDYTLYRDGSDLKWNGSAIGGSTLTAGSGIAIVDNKVHFESKSSGGTVLSSIKKDNDTHVTLLVSGTIVSNAADAARPSCVSIGSGSYISPTFTTGYGDSVAVGALAAVTGGLYGGGTAIGSRSIAYQYAVAVGHAAKADTHVYSTAVGYAADARNEKCVAVGGNSRAENAGVSIGSSAVGENYCVVIGEGANSDSDLSVAIGTSSDANGVSAVAVGAGGTVAERGVALGRSTNAGKFAVALGNQAVAPEKHFVVASGSAQASVMLSGVFGSHLSLPNGQQFRQIASAAQTSDLMQWQNSAGTNVAAMTPSGILNVNQIVASGVGKNDGQFGLHSDHILLGDTKTGGGWYTDDNTFWAVNRSWGWYNGGSSLFTATPTFSSNNHRLDFKSGSTVTASISMDDAREFSINTAGWPVPTRIAGDTNDNLLYVDGADDKVAIGSSDPTYLLDVMGHGAMVRATGVIVGNSGVVLASNTPSVTTNTLYNAGGSLYFNGSAVGGGGAAPASGSIYEVQYNGDGTNLGADSDFTWNPSTNVMSVNGHISASTKSFLINHPTKPDKKLQYACLEGPENGVYVRGHTNDNLIDLPDYWTALVDPESITVQLTAKDAPQPFLYVSGVLNNQVHLISDREISAYYTVSATRKDVDPLLVEPDNY